MPLRTINILEIHVGIYLRDVLARKREEIQGLQGMGEISMIEVVHSIRRFLRDNGINL